MAMRHRFRRMVGEESHADAQCGLTRLCKNPIPAMARSGACNLQREIDLHGRVDCVLGLVWQDILIEFGGVSKPWGA